MVLTRTETVQTGGATRATLLNGGSGTADGRTGGGVLVGGWGVHHPPCGVAAMLFGVGWSALRSEACTGGPVGRLRDIP